MKKTLATLAALITLFAVAPYALALTPAFTTGLPSTSGLVSYYNMQGNSNDVFGSNNGTDTNVSYSTAAGKVGEGVAYTGSASYIQLPYFNLTASTVNMWVYVNNVSSDPDFFVSNQNTSGSNNYVQFGVTGSDALFVYTALNNAQVYTAGGVISNGAWTMLTWVQTGSLLSIYVNGSNQSVTLAGSNSSLYLNAIGGNQSVIGGLKRGTDSEYSPLNGYMDEVNVWSSALTATQISQLYNAGAGETLCNVTGGPLCSTPRHHIIIISLNWKPEPALSFA